MARKGDPDGIEDADVEIGADVKARRLRFRSRPRTDVRIGWRASGRIRR